MKKLFIKICKILGFEIIDQNNFFSPTLDKELNKDLSVINSKVVASGFFIRFDYTKKKFFKILKKKKLDLVKCKFILIRQDPPFNLEYISATYILDTYVFSYIEKGSNYLSRVI